MSYWTRLGMKKRLSEGSFDITSQWEVLNDVENKQKRKLGWGEEEEGLKVCTQSFIAQAFIELLTYSRHRIGPWW